MTSLSRKSAAAIAAILAVVLVISIKYMGGFEILSSKSEESQASRRSSGDNVLKVVKEKSNNEHSMTVITLFVPLGTFQKGGGGNFYTVDKYKNWMLTYSWLTNKVIAFFTDEESLQYFKKMREAQPADRTILIKLDSSQLDAFKNYETVKSIFAAPDYPKHHPNTVNANYSIVMNAKYDALQMAMDMGHVDTPYIAWLDIGTFRNLVDMRPPNNTFTLEVPDGFDNAKVAFTEVTPHDQLKDTSPWDYIRSNHVWVAGSFLFGTTQVIKKFITAYKTTVELLLKERQASTDQQVIGAMYSPKFIKDRDVHIQTYTCSNGQYGLGGSDIQYFCLAYVCKEAAEKRAKAATPKV